MTKSVKKLCIFGTGGFGREVLCCFIDSLPVGEVRLQELVCFMISDELYTEPIVMGIEVIKQSQFEPHLYDVIVAVGEPQSRRKVVESLPGTTTYTTIIHPSAVISAWVDIGEGSIITAGSILTCNIKIGKHSHINLHTTIGHDCSMGDYFTTAPAVNISGNCSFGDCVYFGTNSSARQGVRITGNVTIGMGGVVVKDINEEAVFIGNPAQKLVKKK